LTRDALALATTNDGASLFVIYPRSTLATDVTLRAWASSNLLVWSTNTVTEQLLTDNGTNQVWRASTPTSNQPALFLRLNATQP
jgi:hypothetical protein